ncbi:MAG: tetratricopeptide repeat protein [Myxococcales bacterium]
MLTASAASVRADDQVLSPEVPPAPFWQAAKNPDLARIDALLRQGRARLQPALGFGLLFGAEASIHRRTGVENALARFERALSIDPKHPEALYLAGKALALWERRTPQGKIERRTREAIERFEELRAVDPLYEAEDVAFELGVLLTREEDFRGAAEAYERALALRLGAGSPSTILSNLAEVSMQAEDLERAVSLYGRAALEGSREERVLALWGMAVALDRLGETGESLERAKLAIRDDQRPMAALKQGRVFFVPAYEAHYYDGLGLLAMADLEAGEGLSLEHLLANMQRALSRPAAVNVLVGLRQQLAGLAEEGHGDLLQPLTQLVERNLSKLPRPRPVLRSEEKPLVPEPAAKAGLLCVQSLRAFLRYLDASSKLRGEQGPWALDARAHVDQLLAWLSGGLKPSQATRHAAPNPPQAPR